MPDQPNFIAPLAYENDIFLKGPDGRPLRILAEYAEPLARFRREKIQDTVVFFGSARFSSLSNAQEPPRLLNSASSRKGSCPDPLPSRPSRLPRPARRRHGTLLRRCPPPGQHAHHLSRTLAGKRHRFVVTTGGGPRHHGGADRGAPQAGGKAIGLNIALSADQAPRPLHHPGTQFEFHYFFMRKLWLAYLAKALVVLPRRLGTLDELFEILTLAQTEKARQEDDRPGLRLRVLAPRPQPRSPGRRRNHLPRRRETCFRVRRYPGRRLRPPAGEPHPRPSPVAAPPTATSPKSPPPAAKKQRWSPIRLLWQMWEEDSGVSCQQYQACRLTPPSCSWPPPRPRTTTAHYFQPLHRDLRWRTRSWRSWRFQPLGHRCQHSRILGRNRDFTSRSRSIEAAVKQQPSPSSSS